MTETSRDRSSSDERARLLLSSYVESRGLSLAALASALDMDPASLGKRLAGSEGMSLELVNRVLDVLKVPPEEFFRRLYSDEPLTELEERQRERLSREEVEGVLMEAGSLLRGLRELMDAREKAEREGEGAGEEE